MFLAAFVIREEVFIYSKLSKKFHPDFPWLLLLPYTAGIRAQQEFGSKRLQKGLPATPTAGGAPNPKLQGCGAF